MTGATILLVEDEPQVRTLLARLLEKGGYAVWQAENGREALAVAEGHINRIALVVTDLVMPEMGGAALLRELRSLRNSLPALCMTGYSQDEIVSLDGLDDVALLEKPFTPADFLARVAALISGTDGSAS